MQTRRLIRVKFLALALAGGMMFTLIQNCSIFAGQHFQESLNYTWFLTCRTDTLFSGNSFLIDCGDVDTTSTSDSTSTSSLSGLL